MISPELLRRYPFFGGFNDEYLRQLAMRAELIEVEPEITVVKEGESADTFHLLVDGAADMYFISQETYHPTASKELYIGSINPGEVFGLSALIEPHISKASVRTTQKSHIIAIEAQTLRGLLEDDPHLGYLALKKINQVLMERLVSTRVQLAAAWA